MSTEVPPAGPGHDAGAAAKLQILATEHWSLLATRTLTYNEALSRVTIFLSILSGALIALALVAQADHFGQIFISIAIPMLLIVMFVGITTVSRLTALNRDDYRWVIGMNRLRRGYVDLHPELEQYFITSPHGDLYGALQTLGIDAVSGAIVALVALAIAAPPLAIGIVAAAAFVLVLVVMGAWNRRSIRSSPPSLAPRFPSPRG